MRAATEVAEARARAAAAEEARRAELAAAADVEVVAARRAEELEAMQLAAARKRVEAASAAAAAAAQAAVNELAMTSSFTRMVDLSDHENVTPQQKAQPSKARSSSSEPAVEPSYEAAVLHAREQLKKREEKEDYVRDVRAAAARRPKITGRHKAATHIQACFRRRFVRRTLGVLNEAATIIQKAARGRADRLRLAREGKVVVGNRFTEEQRQQLANRWAGILPDEGDPAVAAAARQKWNREPLKKKHTKVRSGPSSVASSARG